MRYTTNKIYTVVIIVFCIFYSGCGLLNPKEETLLRIEGKVFDVTTNIPIMDATVKLSEFGGVAVYAFTKTDSVGSYYIEYQIEDCQTTLLKIEARKRHLVNGLYVDDYWMESYNFSDFEVFVTPYVRCINILQSIDFSLQPAVL